MSNWQAKQQKTTSLSGLLPIIPIREYQRKVIEDRSRLKAWIKARQIGGTWGATLEMVLDSAERGEDWNTMSRTGRQAIRLLRKAAMHVEALDFYVRHTLGQPTIIEKISTQEIVLKNGAIITAVPCDPDTTVGDTVNWLMDEAALYPKFENIFGTLKPSIMHGKRLMMITTPRGRQGKVADLYFNWKNHGQKKTGWSFHVTTIEDAINQGLVLYDHEGNKLAFKDFRDQEIRDIGMEMWMQEYMCAFQDATTAFFSWNSIQDSVYKGDVRRTPDQLRRIAEGRRGGIGIDVGRKHDLTVIWCIFENPDGSYWTANVHELEKTSLPVQAEIISDYLETGLFDRCCIDAGGLGIGLCDTLQDRFSGTVAPVVFNNTNKVTMGERLRAQLESNAWLMPDDDEIVEDFASIERIVTPQNNIRLEPTGGRRSHGDFFIAAMLALNSFIDPQFGKIAFASAPLR